MRSIGSPTVQIHVQETIGHAVRSQESVFNSLLQGIGENRLAEVFQIIRTELYLRRGGHSYLGRTAEVFQNLSPFGIFLGASAVAFVHHNQVKELWLERCKRIRHTFIVRNQLLVQSHVDFITGIQFLALYLRHYLSEGLEILNHGLVDKDVAVCKIENLLFATGFMQTFHNLERRKRLARSRSHHKQYSLLAFRDSFNRAIDCYTLVIARSMRIHIPIVRFVDNLLLFRSKLLGRFQAHKELFFRRELF